MRRTKVTTAKYWLVAVALLGWTAPGCVSEDDAQGGDGWAICDDCEVEPETQVDQRPDQQSDQPTGEIESCHPQAVLVDPTGLPELPDGMIDGQCSLEQLAADQDADGEADRITRWSRDGNVIEQTIENRGRLWKRTTFELDDDDAIHRVFVRENNIYYGTGHTEREWTVDARGRLLSRSYQSWRGEDGAERLQNEQHMIQTFRGGRLVARTETSSYGDSEDRRSYQWSYDDDGRLVESVAERTPSDTRQSAVWTYEDGRPVSVERRINDVVTVRHSWEFHQDGLVAAHDVEYGQRGLGDHASDVVLRSTQRLDSYDTPNPYALYSPYSQLNNPWSTANTRFDAERGCHTLPNTAGHGYPHDEDAYQLGWKQDDRHASINFISGYGGYGYYGYGYGDQPWYGHAGAGTPWPSSSYRSNQGVLTVQLRYDAHGRMTDEALALAPYIGEEVEDDADPQPMVFQIERERSFGDKGLVEDHIRVESGEETYERSLRFERDQSGDLITRELWQEDTVLAHQSWERDGSGRILEHDVHSAITASMPMELLDMLDQEVEAPVHTGTYERRFDASDRVTLEAAQVYRNGGQRSEYGTEYGEHGPVEETTRHFYNDSESGSRTTYAYDDEGRKELATHDYDSDGQPETQTRYVYQGERLVEVVTLRGGVVQASSSFSYVCQ
jgi:hypothetical protein